MKFCRDGFGREKLKCFEGILLGLFCGFFGRIES